MQTQQYFIYGFNINAMKYMQQYIKFMKETLTGLKFFMV